MGSQHLPYTSTHGITPLISLLLLADALALSVATRSLNPPDGTTEPYEDTKFSRSDAIFMVVLLFTSVFIYYIIFHCFECFESIDASTARPACAGGNLSRREAARWLNCAVCLNEVITSVTSQPKIKQFAMACGVNLVEKKSWSDLPLDIINLIANSLYYTDQLRFRAVCKRWRATKILRYADKLPWLVGYDSRACYLYDPSHKREYTLLNSTTSLQKFMNSTTSLQILNTKQDWVLFTGRSYREIFFFYSPFMDNKIIELPKFPVEILNATFSTTPECEIFVLSYKSIIIYRPRDKNWRLFLTVGFCDWDHNFMYVDGFLYWFIKNGIGAFNVASKKSNILRRPSNNIRNMEFFTQFDEDLLMSSLANNIRSYCVFKLNRSQMDWFEIGSLEGRALFTTSRSRMLVPVAKESELENTIHTFDSDSFKDFSLKFPNYPGGESMILGPMVRDYKVRKIRDWQAFWIMPPLTRQ